MNVSELATAFVVSTMMSMSNVPSDSMGDVSRETAIELYRLHKGDGVGQLNQSVAITRVPEDTRYCLYRSPYKNETGTSILRYVTWTTYAGYGEECPQ